MYEVLSSKLRVKPTFTAAEEVIRKDFKLKLPSRRYIHLWNTPEISQFRGYQDSLDETEERRHVAQVAKLDIRQAARETNEPSMNSEIVQEMMQNQKQSTQALGQHMRDLAEQTRRENMGMAAEQRAELQRLANSHAEAANLQRISETALSGLVRDVALEQRNHIQDLAARAGHVTNNIDSRHFETHNHAHTTNNQTTDVNVHNQAMNLMQSHTQQLGQIMQQQNIGVERMQQGLYNTIMQQQRQAQNIPPQIILHMAPPPPMTIMSYQPPGPPPPPPAAGAIAIPVPVPRPAPTIKPEAIIRQQQRELDSYDRSRKAEKPRVAPWNSGIANPPTLPPPKAAPPSVLPAPIPIPETPTGILPIIPTNAPLPTPPLSFPRGRAPRSLASASTRAPSTRAPSSRARDRSRSVESRATTVAGDSLLTPANLATLDQTDSVIKPRAKSVAKSKPKVKRVNLDGPVEVIQPKPTTRAPRKRIESTTVLPSKRRPTLQGVTTVSAAGVTSKIRVIPLKAATGIPPKRRGRPPGSLGKKKRDRVLEAEQKRVDGQQL
jgi:hypothetical protein